ncbi:MAG: cysteine--tRNA ligase [Chlorobi bacterium]|nr:MAG: cysteinyl-tRNA synthetase [Chlorobi bacterium OLB7]MBK8910314.1 cysteine--tRNA ligase [Chlorobiota bacterium]
MALRIYNTLTRTKEEFHPIDPSLVRFYRCGPTVYKHMHIGHAKSYIGTDVIRRYLMHLYGADHVMFVMNITDVGHLADDSDDGEDKMEAQARRENRSPFEIALFYEQSWFDDLDRLGVLRPDRVPHATDFIRQQISMAEQLIQKGLAYEVNGSVYFDVHAYEQQGVPDGFVPYGGLSNRKVEDQQHGGRIAVFQEKRNPQDFALWKAAEPEHFMQWHSPWGWGYPGWHLECSVMAQYYLGETFDIHSGGLDNMFPHHECEIAQSQAANGKPFVNWWLHVNLIRIGGDKMGASAGNAMTLKQMLEEYDPMAIRYLILQSHYRSPQDFDMESLVAAQSGLERFRRAVERLRQAVGDDADTTTVESMPAWFDEFIAAMDDDFNTTTALGALSAGITELNGLLAAGNADRTTLLGYYKALRVAFDGILGFDLFARPIVAAQNNALTGELMELFIELRREARARKDWAASDLIRDRLKERGVLLEDTKEGTRWAIAE